MAHRLASKLARKLLTEIPTGSRAGCRTAQNGSIEPGLSKSNLTGPPSQQLAARFTEAGQSVEPGNVFNPSRGLFGREMFPASASTSGRGVAGFASSAWPEMPSPQSMAPKYIKKGLTWVGILLDCLSRSFHILTALLFPMPAVPPSLHL